MISESMRFLAQPRETSPTLTMCSSFVRRRTKGGFVRKANLNPMFNPGSMARPVGPAFKSEKRASARFRGCKRREEGGHLERGIGLKAGGAGGEAGAPADPFLRLRFR